MSTFNARVKLGLTTLSSTELVATAQGIHDAMVGNINFPTPTPTLPVVQTAITALATANADVDNNGGKVEHQARRVAERALRALLKQLGAYVQMASNGVEDIILSSAFGVVKRGGPIGELNPPRDLVSNITHKTGRVSMKWNRDAGTDSSHVYMSTKNDPFEWSLVGVTTKSRFDVNGLDPRQLYWFSVTAIGAAGESSKSEPLLAMAAA